MVSDRQRLLRVAPVTDGNRAFVEWWATFDCADDEHDRWIEHFEHEGFAKWLASLRTRLSA
jgi:hypothetical protein